MPKKRETGEERTFTCPNSSCGLVFSKPVKVKNMRSNDQECYDACPRCLTAITVEESVPVIDSEPLTDVGSSNEQEIVNDSELRKPEPVATVHCAHQIGYLSSRPKNEKIPEECMVCENIVQCMLKLVKG